MTSNRMVLGILGIVFLVIVILSSSKILDSLRKKTGIFPKREEIKNTNITATPIPLSDRNGANDKNNNESTTFNGSETPATGPSALIYLLLGGGIFAGAAIKKFKG